METILSQYPRSIAWALSEVDIASDPVAKYHHLLEAYEETVRYLTLVDMSV